MKSVVHPRVLKKPQALVNTVLSFRQRAVLLLIFKRREYQATPTRQGGSSTQPELVSLNFVRLSNPVAVPQPVEVPVPNPIEVPKVMAVAEPYPSVFFKCGM